MLTSLLVVVDIVIVIVVVVIVAVLVVADVDVVFVVVVVVVVPAAVIVKVSKKIYSYGLSWYLKSSGSQPVVVCEAQNIAKSALNTH